MEWHESVVSVGAGGTQQKGGIVKTCNKCGQTGLRWAKTASGKWYLPHSCRKGGSNERHSSLSDYAHWNEEAPIIKALEDRYADRYADYD